MASDPHKKGCPVAYKPIGDYGLIGDMHSCALVGLDGSIDWACFPRFDSPSVFAAILDDEKGGRFRIAPTQAYEVSQRYLPDTNILSTVFQTSSGELELVDFMPLGPDGDPLASPHEIHRLVRCTRGEVEASCLFQPRFDYAADVPRLEAHAHGVIARGQGETGVLSADQSFLVEGGAAVARFTLTQGQEAAFVYAHGRASPPSVATFSSQSRVLEAQRYWVSLAEGIDYEGPWRDQVIRSVLVLHLLTYQPSGAMVAAATTSLPEAIGGQRNWDYRYCWVRDAVFVLGILFRLGDNDEAQRFYGWLLDASTATDRSVHVLYGIAPESDLTERELEHLEGYKGSRPVRIGNGAAEQFQLDVYGELIMSVDTWHRYGGDIDAKTWDLVQGFAERVVKNWQSPDRGIWEIRGPEGHFVFSKVMSWVALYRAASLARHLGLGNELDVSRWEQTAEQIKQEVMQRGWSEEKQSFVQRYGSDDLDASNLLIGYLGFLLPEDPRIRSTVQATWQELGEGTLMRRYESSAIGDGLQGEEGAFTICSFWLIGALLACGRVQEAHTMFEEMLGYSNHLGLFAEMIDPVTKEMLGNFPQAFSHVGLLHTARNLAAALRGESPKTEV